MEPTRGIFENVAMSDYLAAPAISGSALAKIDATTPAHWRASLATRKQTPEMAFGTAFHSYVLEPGKFAAEYAVKPEDMSFATKEGKAWRAEQGNKAIIAHDDFEALKGMAAAMRAKPMTAKLLAGAKPEVTLFDQIAGTWVKSRPDALNERLGVAVNLKTCEDASDGAVQKRIADFGGTYYVSAALCLDVLRSVTGRDWQYIFVFVEKEAPYESRRVMLKPTVIDWGRMRYKRALATFAECMKSGVWPGYPDDTIEADLPVWAEKGLQARHERGEFSEGSGQ
jgi:exodeoxyribonuclease VIII